MFLISINFKRLSNLIQTLPRQIENNIPNILLHTDPLNPIPAKTDIVEFHLLIVVVVLYHDDLLLPLRAYFSLLNQHDCFIFLLNLILCLTYHGKSLHQILEEFLCCCDFLLEHKK